MAIDQKLPSAIPIGDGRKQQTSANQFWISFGGDTSPVCSDVSSIQIIGGIITHWDRGQHSLNYTGNKNMVDNNHYCQCLIVSVDLPIEGNISLLCKSIWNIEWHRVYIPLLLVKYTPDQ